MSWFKNLKTRSKLLAGFGVMCALMIGVSGFAYKTLAEIQKVEREEVARNNDAAMDAREVRAVQNRIRALMLEMLLSQDAAQKALLRRQIGDSGKEIDLAVDRLKAFVTSQALSNDVALLAEFQKELAA